MTSRTPTYRLWRNVLIGVALCIALTLLVVQVAA